VVLVVLVAVVRVVAAQAQLELQERQTPVAVEAVVRSLVLFLERVVRELLWCVMHCQMFRYQIFMQRMTWVVHQQTISHLQQH
jgi:hypothetical protein